jgi:hypothetical protein
MRRTYWPGTNEGVCRATTPSAVAPPAASTRSGLRRCARGRSFGERRSGACFGGSALVVTVGLRQRNNSASYVRAQAALRWHLRRGGPTAAPPRGGPRPLAGGRRTRTGRGAAQPGRERASRGGPGSPASVGKQEVVELGRPPCVPRARPPRGPRARLRRATSDGSQARRTRFGRVVRRRACLAAAAGVGCGTNGTQMAGERKPIPSLAGRHNAGSQARTGERASARPPQSAAPIT